MPPRYPQGSKPEPPPPPRRHKRAPQPHTQGLLRLLTNRHRRSLFSGEDHFYFSQMEKRRAKSLSRSLTHPSHFRTFAHGAPQHTPRNPSTIRVRFISDSLDLTISPIAYAVPPVQDSTSSQRAPMPAPRSPKSGTGGREKYQPAPPIRLVASRRCLLSNLEHMICPFYLIARNISTVLPNPHAIKHHMPILACRSLVLKHIHLALWNYLLIPSYRSM